MFVCVRACVRACVCAYVCVDAARQNQALFAGPRSAEELNYSINLQNVESGFLTESVGKDNAML